MTTSVKPVERLDYDLLVNPSYVDANGTPYNSLVQQALDALDFEQAVLSNAAQSPKARAKPFLEQASQVLRVMLHGTNSTFSTAYDSFPFKLCSKPELYAFLASGQFNWWDVCAQMALNLISKLNLTTKERKAALLIVGDTQLSSDRSQQSKAPYPELDSSEGLRLLSVGICFPSRKIYIPLRDQIMVSRDDMYMEIDDAPDQRTRHGKYLKLCHLSKPKILIQILADLRKLGIYTSRIVAGTWYTQPAVMRKLDEAGYEVIGKLEANTFEFVDAITRQSFTIKSELDGIQQQLENGATFEQVAYAKQAWLNPPAYKSGDDDQPIRTNIVFSRNPQGEPQEQSPYIAVICTDCDMLPPEVCAAYSQRYQIDNNFSCLKDAFGLDDVNFSRLIESNIALVSLCQIRYIIALFVHFVLQQGATFAEACDLTFKETEHMASLLRQ